MAEYLVQDTSLHAVAESIRSKLKITDSLVFPDDFCGAIDAISTEVTPTISVSSSGLITATAGTKSATKQLTTQASKTVTPTTKEQTLAPPNVYTTGYLRIAGDTNLVPENIVSGVSIFGVDGVADVLPAGIVAMNRGSFTLSSDKTSTHSIDTDVYGVNFLMIYADGKIQYRESANIGDSRLTLNRIGTFMAIKKTIGSGGSDYKCLAHYTYSGGQQLSEDHLLTGSSYFVANSPTGRVNIPCSSTLILQSGITYHWVAGILVGMDAGSV